MSSSDTMMAEAMRRLERVAAVAQEVMAADPRLGPISASIIAGDQISRDDARQWVESGEKDAATAMHFVGSFYRLDFALWAVEAGHLERHLLLRDLPELWRGSDPDDTDPRFLALWKEHRAKRRSYYSDGKRLLNRYPWIRVYRGQDEDAPLGIAWSRDMAVAKKFAHGAGTRQANRQGAVLKGYVARTDVLAYLTGRGEQEVVVDPDAVAGVQVIGRWERA